MDINQALAASSTIKRAKVLAGPHASYPFTQDQLADIIITLADTYTALVLTNKDELTKSRRQTAAAEARYARLEKRTKISVDPLTDDELQVV